MSEFERLLEARAPEQGELALAARALVLEEAPTAWQLIYDTYALSVALSWTAALGDAFCHVAVYRNHVNLGFNRGSELDDPAGLLRGTGKLIRHVRLASVQDLRRLELRALVAQAVAHALERLGDRAPTPGEVVLR